MDKHERQINELQKQIDEARGQVNEARDRAECLMEDLFRIGEMLGNTLKIRIVKTPKKEK